MGLNTDIRQAITLALQTEGVDAAGQVIDKLQSLSRETDVVRKQMEEASVSFVDGSAMLAKLAKEGDKWRAVLREIRDQQERAASGQDQFAQSLEETLIPLNSLIVAGNKFRGVLDQIEDKREAGDSKQQDKDRAQQLQDEAALQAKLGEMEQRNSDNRKQAIQDHIADTERQRVAEIKAMGDRAQGYARAEQQEEERIARLDKLNAAARKEAAAEEWMTRQTEELAQAMQGLAASEKDASTFSFFTEPQRNVIGQTTQQFAALQDQMKAIGRTTQVASGGFFGVVDSLRGVGTQSKAAATSLGGYASKSEEAAQSTKRGSYAFLNFAHAAQDAQYGLGAVLNNIPLIVSGMGGSAGLAGTVMLAGVALNTTAPYWETYGRKIGALRDPLRDATDSIGGMTEKLAAMEARPFKLEQDFQAIARLKDEIREATKAISEWEALKGRDSKAKRTAKEIIDEGVVEGGGGSALEKALIAIAKRDGTFGAGSELHGQIAVQKGRLGVADAAIKNFGGEDAMLAQPFVLHRDYIRSQIADLEKQMRDEAVQKIADLRNLRFGEGSRKTLEDLLLDPRNKGILEQHGVNYKAAQGVVYASPENMAAEASRVKDEKEQKAAADLAKKAAAKAQADGVWQNEQNERIKREAEAEAKRQGRDVAADARKAATAAGKDARAQQQGANRIDDGIKPFLEDAFAQNRLAQTQGGGVREGDLNRALTANVAQFLRQNGQDPRLADEVVANAFREMSEQYTKQQAMTGNAVQSLLSVIAQARAQANAQQQATFRLWMQAQGLQGQAARGRQRKPTLNTFNMGAW